MSGKLYVVATPIGNLQDLSPRAIAILKTVDLIVCEDTRHSKPLLRHFDINTPCLSLHQHNEQQRLEEITKELQLEKTLALISDAGTPLISDPGARLLQTLHEQQIKIIPIPGPSAVISALSVSGFPAEQFVFAGFVPAQKNARIKYLKNYEKEIRTWVIYEAPHRIDALLEDMAEILGQTHIITLCKELTKQFETVYCASISEVQSWLNSDPMHSKGEFVIVVSGYIETEPSSISDEASNLLTLLSKELPLKRAAALTAEYTGVSKNKLYQLGLEKAHRK